MTINYIHKTFTIFYIGPTDLLAASFFIAGSCLARAQCKPFNWWQLLLAFTIMVINSHFNLISIGDPFYETEKIIPYTVTAVLGTWCIYSIPWHLLKGKAVVLMTYIGNHTLSILTWHFLCFKLVTLIIIKVYDFPLSRLAELPTISDVSITNSGWFVPYIIVGVGLPLLLTYSYEKVRCRMKSR